MADEYDVFICYNSEDKLLVKEIRKQLVECGIVPWQDIWELRPGLPWQPLLEAQIGSVKSAAVFVGKDGIGPWQRMEIDAFLREFVRRGCPVIPVLLSSAPKKPELPLFLQGMTWVDFREQDRKLDPEEDPLNRLIYGITGRKLWEESQKDFYISHDKEDRNWADWITWQLEKEGGYTCINPSWDFLAGSNLVHDIQEAMQRAKCTLAVFSPSYLRSPLTQAEWAAAFNQDPIGKSGKLLPIVVGECERQGLLASIVSIDLMQCDDAPTALRRLLAGVQRLPFRPLVSPPFPGAASYTVSEAPFYPHKNILIASLGDSPAIISAMYDQLTKKKDLSIDQVVILCPEDDEDVDEDVKCAYGLVQRALSGLIAEERLIYKPLPFRDVDSLDNGRLFLKKLYTLLLQYQEKGDTVYLSLAGGRKSMAALMAWVAPFFSCIKNLYHIIDREEQIHGPRYFLPVRTIARLSEKRFERVMHPSDDQVILVDIPFEKGKQLGWDMRRKLSNVSPSELIKGEYEVAEGRISGWMAMQRGGSALEVCVTEEARQQFELLSKRDPKMARLVKNVLLMLSDMDVLFDDLQQADDEPDTFLARLDGSRHAKRLLRYLKGLEVPVRPVFYTDPNDLADYPDKEINKVVVCSLEQEEGGTYRSLQEVKATRGSFVASDLLAPPDPADSVLIVPLGSSPMVATQLYTLLKEQEQRTIRALVLIYPEQSQSIVNGVRIIEHILPEGVRCENAEVKGYEDIDSTEACSDFQQVLEDEIERVRREYRGCKVDIALSGGRKGMTAMTIFAAQRKNIPFVYHTLIPDKKLSEKIEEETSVEKLNDMPPEKQFKHLFLDEYNSPDEQPYRYSRFKLFRVPVFPIED